VILDPTRAEATQNHITLTGGHRLSFAEFGDLQGKNDSGRLTIFPVDLDPISSVYQLDTPFFC